MSGRRGSLPALLLTVALATLSAPAYAAEGGGDTARTTAPAAGQAIVVDKDDLARTSVDNRNKPHENITGKKGQEGQYTKTLTWSETIDGKSALLLVLLQVESVDPVTWHHLRYTPSGGDAIVLKEVAGASDSQLEPIPGGMQTFIYYATLGDVTKGKGELSVRLTFEDTGTAIFASLVFYGIDQVKPVFGAATGGTIQDGNTLGTTISAGQGGKMIVSLIGDNHAHTWKPDSGQTKQWDLRVSTGSQSSMAAGTLYVTDAGDQKIQWTASDTWNRVAHSLVVLNPVQ